jgi:hypothetical protein
MSSSQPFIIEGMMIRSSISGDPVLAADRINSL